MPFQIRIIARTNGVGIDRDVALVSDALRAVGMDVELSHCRAISPLRRFTSSRRVVDANIFVERVFPRWLSSASVNLLIPNQERFPKRHLQQLKHIDAVLCKSRHAEAIFRNYANTCFIGFSSKCIYNPAIEKDFLSFFHLAGRSTLKGTETVLSLWEKHPEWPGLTLVQSSGHAPRRAPENVQLVPRFVSDDELAAIMNRHGVHLCPSRSEGWGHYITEALACGSVVLTTDAPPMNELIDPSRGILIPYTATRPRHLGTSYLADPSALEAAISTVVKMPLERKMEFATSGRDWYLDNDLRFRNQLPQVVASVLDGLCQS